MYMLAKVQLLYIPTIEGSYNKFNLLTNSHLVFV